ncbi:uncharacterized protein EDB93DRAFT_716599 [Suillus bovinus]|uniref:uncharacterized protein n=1 Tax=Suillus bovinus TaxID=48563 RepID=UPI001B8780C8|nr:uncharacterized protein EDB93DRAFT_716599 [Suillus bovinus]KAG2138591.1 hypothetical protein EDB93DRAFT_716599 [Suillus bovinus]
MRNLDVCKKIYLRLGSSGPYASWKLSKVLQNALRFTLIAAKVSRDPAHLWYGHYSETGDSRSPEDLDWLMDYLEYIYFGYEETAFDILLLLDVMKVRCSPAKYHQFFKTLIPCMGSYMPHHSRHVALRAARNAREEIASIDAIHDVELRDMILTKLSPAILIAACPQPDDATLSDDGPDPFFHYDRDLCYLELLFALARNSKWHPHLFRDHHIDRCIGIIAHCRFGPHAFYLAGILLRIAPEQLSVTSLDFITGQWWNIISDAWSGTSSIMRIDDARFFEFLPVLVEGTKKYMHIAYGLQYLITKVDYVLGLLERRYSEQGEGLAVAVKELRTVASEMLEKSVSSKGVSSP